MVDKTFDLEKNLAVDVLANNISNKWQQWLFARHEWEERYRKTLSYLYSTSTDTIYGQNSNPWSANVHIPKLTQLRDVLVTYELESLFSLSDYYEFEGFTKDANTLENRRLVKNMLKNILDKGDFKGITEKLVTDYIDAGNAFAMPVWETDKVKNAAGVERINWEGPVAHRINPLDIVFDPLAVDFKSSPKILRTVLSIGDLALLAQNDPVMKKGFDRAMHNRRKIREAIVNGDTIKSDQLTIAGFGNWKSYMSSDTVELLTFYGTLYNVEDKTLHEHTKITIMDRSVVLKEEPMEDIGGYDWIHHVGYRDRKDILWAMSPLENCLGMQSRIDFLENKRSDCYDYTVNPIRKIKGQVDIPDALGPGDDVRMDVDSDVSYLAPDTSILTADNQIDRYEYKMEEFMGSPKEVLGYRTPGEKTMFEVNQIFTAATRIFNRQIRKFEKDIFEPMINDMFQLWMRNKAGQTIQLKYWDTEREMYAFKDVNIDDINAMGRIKVNGSSTYQDKQQIAQALQMLGQNPLFLDEVVRNNFSPTELGQVFLWVSGLDKFPHLFKKDQRLYEITDQQKLVERLQQQVDAQKAEGMAELQEGSNQFELQKQLQLQRTLGAADGEQV